MARDLLRPDGSPVGISYVPAYSTRGAALRVAAASRKEVLLGAGGDFDAVYLQAVNQRLLNLELWEDEDARQALLGAKEAFMKRYRLKLEPVTLLKLIQEEACNEKSES